MADFEESLDSLDSNAEIEKISPEQRLKIIKRSKQIQLARYLEWEQEVVKNPQTTKISTNRKKKILRIHSSIKIFDDISNFDLEAVKNLINDSNIGVNLQKIGNGASLLHQACIVNNTEAAKFVLTKFANPNIQDIDLWTPLHIAAYFNFTEMVQLLILFDADPVILNMDGCFAIDYSQGPTREIITKWLSSRGITFENLKEMRRIPRKQMYSDIKTLTADSKDINKGNSRNITLLHIAAANGYYDCARELINSNADLNLQDDRGNTALHCAAKYNHSKLLKLLIAAKANPLIKNHSNDIPADLVENDSLREILQDAGFEYSINVSTEIHTEQLKMTRDNSSDDNLMGNEEFQPPNISKSLPTKKESYSKPEELFEYETLSEKEKYIIQDDDNSKSNEAVERLSNRKSITRSYRQKPQLPAQCGSDDLATLSNMSEHTILQELQQRYSHDQIYTYVGDILIAINPFKLLPYYSSKVSREYHHITNRNSMPPHIYASSDLVLQNMIRDKHPQCCVISGESGAGKTETSKFIVEHILANAICLESSLNIKIQQASPLLEAFGNSETIMNDNSSRFGKYFEIIFNGQGAVTGAFLREYLLEKSRIVYQPRQERNFHIFYMLFAGLSTEEKIKFDLGSPSVHRCLTENGLSLEGMFEKDKREEFEEIRDCLQAIGFSKEDEISLIKALSAVLHLCDIKFTPEGTNKSAKILNNNILQKVCNLLEVDTEELGSSLIEDIHVIHGEQTIRQRNVLQAGDCRDALAKAIYQRMFSWIVNTVNHLLQPIQTIESNPMRISILDIFGFENFEKNGFEQMCINLANEQLQYYFNEHVFEYEKNECLKEGVSISAITYTSNRPILDLFLDKHLGILAQIDEQSRFNTSTDESMATAMHQAHSKNMRNIYHAPRDMGPTFSVVHYAGIVKYDIAGFLEKNRDTLPQALQMAMRTSGTFLLREMFAAKLTRNGSIQPSLRQKSTRKSDKSPFAFFKKQITNEVNASRKVKNNSRNKDISRRGAPTVAFHFRNSLQELMDKMSMANPHFIRCIKPNTRKVPDAFNPEYILTQLRYTGVMETTRIRRQGYATRLTFSEFIKRYPALRIVYIPSKSGTPHSGEAKFILNKLEMKDWEIGKTKLFLKYYHTEILAQMEEKIIEKFLKCQKVIRGFIARCKYLRLRDQMVRQGVVMKVFLEIIPKQQFEISDSLSYLMSIDSEKFRILQEKKQEEEERLRIEEEEKLRIEEAERLKIEEEERLRLEEGERLRRLLIQQEEEMKCENDLNKSNQEIAVNERFGDEESQIIDNIENLTSSNQKIENNGIKSFSLEISQRRSDDINEVREEVKIQEMEKTLRDQQELIDKLLSQVSNPETKTIVNTSHNPSAASNEILQTDKILLAQFLNKNNSYNNESLNLTERLLLETDSKIAQMDNETWPSIEIFNSFGLNSENFDLNSESKLLQSIDEKIQSLKEKEISLEKVDNLKLQDSLPVSEDATKRKINRKRNSIKIKSDLGNLRVQQKLSMLDKEYQQIKMTQAERNEEIEELKNSLIRSEQKLSQDSNSNNEEELNLLLKKYELVETLRELRKKESEGKDVSQVLEVLLQKDIVVTKLLKQNEDEKQEMELRHAVEREQINTDKAKLESLLKEDIDLKAKESLLLDQIQKVKILEEDQSKLKKIEELEHFTNFHVLPNESGNLDNMKLEEQLLLLEDHENYLINLMPIKVSELQQKVITVEQRIQDLKLLESKIMDNFQKMAQQNNKQVAKILEVTILKSKREELKREKELEVSFTQQDTFFANQRQDLEKKWNDINDLNNIVESMQNDSLLHMEAANKREEQCKLKEDKLNEREKLILSRETEIANIKDMNNRKQQLERVKSDFENLNHLKTIENQTIADLDHREKILKEREIRVCAICDALNFNLQEIEEGMGTLSHSTEILEVPPKNSDIIFPLPPPMDELILPPPSSNIPISSINSRTDVHQIPDNKHTQTTNSNSQQVATSTVIPLPIQKSFISSNLESPTNSLPIFVNHIPYPPDNLPVLSNDYNIGIVPPLNHPFNPDGFVIHTSSTTQACDTPPIFDSRIPVPPPDMPISAKSNAIIGFSKKVGVITADLLRKSRSRFKTKETKPPQKSNEDSMSQLMNDIITKGQSGLRSNQGNKQIYRAKSTESLDAVSSDAKSENIKFALNKEYKQQVPKFKRSLTETNLELYSNDINTSNENTNSNNKNNNNDKNNNVSISSSALNDEEQEKIAHMPEWKRELYLRKKGLIPNQ